MWKLPFVLAVVAGLDANAPLVPVQSQQHQSATAEGNQQAKQDQRGTETSPIFVKVIPTEKTDAEARKEEKSANDKGLNDWWTLFCLGAAALFTGIGAVIMAIQAGFFWSQLRKMEASLEAAADTNQIAKDSIAAANRPWVSVEIDDGKGVQWDKNGMLLTIGLKLVNSGNSPAHKVHVIAKGYVGFTPGIDTRTEKAEIRAIQAALIGDGDITIFHGKDAAQNREFRFTDAEVAAAEAEMNRIGITAPHRSGVRVTVFGSVGYETPFSPKRHQTTFSLVYYRDATGLLGGFDRASGDIPDKDIRVHMWQVTAD